MPVRPGAWTPSAGPVAVLSHRRSRLCRRHRDRRRSPDPEHHRTLPRLGPDGAMEMLTAARSGDDPFTAKRRHTKMEMGDATTYPRALIAALDDEVTPKTRPCWTCSFSAPAARRPRHLEEAIRSMAEVDEDGERRRRSAAVPRGPPARVSCGGGGGFGPIRITGAVVVQAGQRLETV